MSLSVYAAGLSAEEQVARWYTSRGYEVLEMRWRVPEGEIDLIVKGECLVFVEVKQSKGTASDRITPRQIARIREAASVYMEATDVDCRFDAAFVTGAGDIEVIEGAF